MKQSTTLSKAARFLLSVALFTTCSLNATRVEPQVGDPIWKLSSRLGKVFDETVPIPLENSDAVGEILTIDQSGTYYLPRDLMDVRIVIDAPNVYLNLRGRSIINTNADNTDESLITIEPDMTNVFVHNGYLYNDAGNGTGSGVLVKESASKIVIENLFIFGCANGIRLAGLPGSEVIETELIGLDLTSNTTGIVLINANKNIFKNCVAQNNAQAGFELVDSQTNCFFECESIETFHTDGMAAGFISTNGRGNLFKSCIVKDTKTGAEDFCNKSYGFLLTGTEQCTKIINCVINETDMTSTVSACSIGICLKGELLATSTIEPEPGELLYEIDSRLVGEDASVLSIAWSPCGNFLATGDIGPEPNEGFLRTFCFNGSILSEIDNSKIGDSVDSVDWSPCGRFIAAVETSLTSTGLNVFNFNGQTLTTVDTYEDASIKGIKWSPDGKYIIAQKIDDLFIFKFENNNIIPFIPSPYIPGVIAVTWSPCGRFIALLNDSDKIAVYKIDNIFNFIDTLSIGEEVSDLDWSPCGKFIAVANNVGKVQVYSFDESLTGSEIYFTAESNDSGTVILRVNWSPCGKFIVSTDEANFIRVFELVSSGSTLALNEVSNIEIPDAAFRSIKWSPSGRFIATGETASLLRVFDAMHAPEYNLIKNNIIADTLAFGPLHGLGILAGGNNCVVQNCGYNNEVNYSWGIPHIYYANQSDTIRPFDNSSVPPF